MYDSDLKWGDGKNYIAMFTTNSMLDSQQRTAVLFLFPRPM